MKKYNTMYLGGLIKYLVNHHDGLKTHRDGSPFYDIAIFKNKKKMALFTKELEKQGYVYGNN